MRDSLAVDGEYSRLTRGAASRLDEGEYSRITLDDGVRACRDDSRTTDDEPRLTGGDSRITGEDWRGAAALRELGFEMPDDDRGGADGADGDGPRDGPESLGVARGADGAEPPPPPPEGEEGAEDGV